MSNNTSFSLQGKLLIATPEMDDPNFKRSVVYMCIHDETHALGLIINRKKSGLTLSDILTQVPPELQKHGQVSDQYMKPVLFGGPVGTEQGFVLHTALDEGVTHPPSKDAPLSMPLTETLFLTAHASILTTLLSETPPRHALLALGYAGWDAGQIEDEIKDNCWIVVESNDELIFDPDLDQKWDKALAKLGITADQLASQTGLT